MAVLAVAFADDFAGGDIQGGKERGGAVAIVVVGSALRLSGFHRQNRLAAFKAWTWLFSSTQSTMARVCSGGLR